MDLAWCSVCLWIQKVVAYCWGFKRIHCLAVYSASRLGCGIKKSEDKNLIRAMLELMCDFLRDYLMIQGRLGFSLTSHWLIINFVLTRDTFARTITYPGLSSHTLKIVQLIFFQLLISTLPAWPFLPLDYSGCNLS